MPACRLCGGSRGNLYSLNSVLPCKPDGGWAGIQASSWPSRNSSYFAVAFFCSAQRHLTASTMRFRPTGVRFLCFLTGFLAARAAALERRAVRLTALQKESGHCGWGGGHCHPEHREAGSAGRRRTLARSPGREWGLSGYGWVSRDAGQGVAAEPQGDGCIGRAIVTQIAEYLLLLACILAG